MAHIFISYAHEDGEFAGQLIQHLREAGLDFWLDSEQLRAGRDWRKGIDDGIRASFALVVVMTPEAKASEYVTYEWAFALGESVTVVPVLLKSTQLHPRLEVLQYLDFTHSNRQPWDILIDQLRILEAEYASKPTLKVALVQDGGDKTHYLVDIHQKARKLPDYDTVTFLKNVLGELDAVPQMSSSEITKLRGEAIISVKNWSLQRPKTPEEEHRDKVQSAFTVDWDFDEDAQPQKVVFGIHHVSNEVTSIRQITFQPNFTDFSDRDMHASYVRKSGGAVLLASSQNVPPHSQFRVEMMLSKRWTAQEIAKIRHKMGYIVIEVDSEDQPVETIYSA